MTTAEELTVDELAARTGMTVRTVRFYTAEGLLPPPERRGRIAYYGAQHRMRLELIRELQAHGYTLTAIDRALQRIPVDASPAEYAMRAALLAPWLPDATEELDRAELDRRAGRPLSRRDLDLLLAGGVVERSGRGRYRTTPGMLSLTVELLDLPVPAAFLREAFAVVDEHAAAVAEALTEVFRRGIWEPYRRGESTAVREEQLTAIVARLRPLAVQGLVRAFGRAADRAVRRTVSG